MKTLLPFLLLLAFYGRTRATFCVCKDGAGDASLQKTLDYACGAGADCNPIHQNGGCYQPNTVKDHCSWAANSYFQRKGQTNGSCDFSGTAMQTQTQPTNAPSTCVYPSSPGTAGTTSSTPGVFGISPTGSDTDNNGIGIIFIPNSLLFSSLLFALCLLLRF